MSDGRVRLREFIRRVQTELRDAALDALGECSADANAIEKIRAFFAARMADVRKDFVGGGLCGFLRRTEEGEHLVVPVANVDAYACLQVVRVEDVSWALEMRRDSSVPVSVPPDVEVFVEHGSNPSVAGVEPVVDARKLRLLPSLTATYAESELYPENGGYCEPHRPGSLPVWHESVEDYLHDKLGFCGCGYPDDAAEFVRDALLSVYGVGDELVLATGKPVLRTYREHDAAAEALRRLARCVFGDDDGLKMFVYYVLTELGLLEHGGCVPGWLTAEGRRVLCDLITLYGRPTRFDAEEATDSASGGVLKAGESFGVSVLRRGRRDSRAGLD